MACKDKTRTQRFAIMNKELIYGQLFISCSVDVY